MLAQFSIWPMDSPHIGRDIAALSEVLDGHPVRYQIGPMATTVEGTWEDVMGAIRACHESVRDHHQRLITTITLDDDTTRQRTMRDATADIPAETPSGG